MNNVSKMCLMDKVLVKLMKSCNVPRKHLQCTSIVVIGVACLLMYTCSYYLGFFKTEDRYTTALLSDVMVPSYSPSPLDTQREGAGKNSLDVTTVNSHGEIPAELNSNSKENNGFKPTFISTSISDVNNDQVQRYLEHRNSTQTHQESDVTSNDILAKKDPEANRVGPLHSFYPGGFVDPGALAAQRCRARARERQGSVQLQLQVLVFSAPGHWARREAIRRAWARPLAALRAAPLAFLVGLAPEPRHEWALAREQLAHGDLVRPDFIDDYRNLSLKTVSMLQWFSEHCNASYLLKIDDDVAFSAQKLENVLKKHANLKNAIIGQVVNRGKPIRSVANKYYISVLQWPNGSFPHFTSGPSYLVTGNAVKVLYQRALQTASPVAFLPLEDVLVTGVVAAAAGVQLQSEPRWISEEPRTNSCLRQVLARSRGATAARPSCVLATRQHVVYHSVSYIHMPILIEALG